LHLPFALHRFAAAPDRVAGLAACPATRGLNVSDGLVKGAEAIYDPTHPSMRQSRTRVCPFLHRRTKGKSQAVSRCDWMIWAIVVFGAVLF